MITRLQSFLRDRWQALPHARRERLARLALWLRFHSTEIALPWLGRNYVWFVIAAAAGVLVLAYFGEGIAVDLYRAVARTAERLATESLTPEAFWRYALSLGALLAALAAAAAIPFQLIKTWLNERATSASEQAAITQRITEAVQMLGATREEKVRRRLTAWYERERAEDPHNKFSIIYAYEYEGRPPPPPIWFNRLTNLESFEEVRNNYEETDLNSRRDNRVSAKIPCGWTQPDFAEAEESRPNLEVRLGALFALERLSQDSRRDHVALMETICAYIRENFPAAEAPGLGLPDWPEPLPDDASPEDRKARAERLRPRTGLESAARRRGRTLPEPRADLQTALALLGRRQAARRWLERRGRTPYALDLRAASLQRVDLKGLHLSHALMTGARMQGATLYGAKMEAAVLFEANLEGADVRSARMQGADLSKARMEGADLSGAKMQGAVFFRARMEGTDLRGATIQRAVLSDARMEAAILFKTRMEGANLFGARMESANLSEAKIEGADLRSSRMQGANLSGARMERADFRGTKMQGANLIEARMEGADLRWAVFDNALIWYATATSARFSGASFDGAGLMHADVTDLHDLDPKAFATAFADGSVKLPMGVDPPPHWRLETLTEAAFLSRWRGWREARGLPWPPPGRALSGGVLGREGAHDLPAIPATPPDRPVDPSEIAG